MTVLDTANDHHRIVIGVDDAPEIVSLLREILAGAGYSFFGCASGAECLQLVTRVMPRLILLDVEMPEMDGFATCQNLRKRREIDAVPIAFLTSRKTRHDVRNGLQVGANDFITKPFQRAALLDRVEHWSRRRLETGFRARAS